MSGLVTRSYNSIYSDATRATASAPTTTIDAMTLAASSIGGAKSLPPLPTLMPLLLPLDPLGLPFKNTRQVGRGAVSR